MPEAQNTMIQNLSAAFTAAGVDVKGLLAKIGDLGALTTTQKASLVGALNELKTGIDAAQTLNDTQKQQARENIDAVSAAQLAATAKTVAEKANGDLTTFKTNIGDTTVDFAAVYTAARDAE